ncbi:hypothetical protein AAMO2058_000412900 [Amorphochlora amoebiformis]
MEPAQVVEACVSNFFLGKGIEASDNLIKLIVRKWTKVVHPVLERTMKGEDWEKVLIEEYKKLDVDKNGFIDGNEILPALERTHELVGELLELPEAFFAELKAPGITKDLKLIMSKFDENADGKFNAKEFKKYVEWAAYMIQAKFWINGELKAIKSGNKGQADKKSIPPILVNATKTHFKYPRDVRKEERWPENSPEYKAGISRENRVKPPPPEVEGDVFDRQRVIVGFNQGIIEQQVCFVLGTGGIGQDTALTLARLGVGKIIMLDCDTYDASNLTRQCLGSLEDVGLRKVDAAARNIKHHNIRSEIETIHVDALAKWDTVVEIARRCTAIFNGVDLGPIWDLCVTSLAKEVGVPYIAGQSYDWMFNVEYYSGDRSKLCSWCAEAKSEQEWIKNQLGSHFGLGRECKYIMERLEAFMKSRKYKECDSKCLTAFLKADKRKFRMAGPTVATLVTASLKKLGKETIKIEELMGFLEKLMHELTMLLLPGSITKLKEIMFIPHPKHVETRFVGSWVCPCLAAGVLMVSQFANALTGREGQAKDPPCNITFNLGWGQTVEEKGYQQTASLVQQGIFPTSALESITEERPRASNPSKPFCAICNRSKKFDS